MTAERRRRVYDIASKHNLIILEDDPYCNLRYDDHPLPSFLSLDRDGVLCFLFVVVVFLVCCWLLVA